MNKISKLLLCLSVSVCITTDIVYCDSVPIRRYTTNNSAIQSSSIIYTNVNSKHGDESLAPAIKEIEGKINANPNDYSLYVSLIDLYMRSGKYNESFSELVFLTNLAKKDKLDSSVRTELNNIYMQNKRNVHYDGNRGKLYMNLALMGVALKDYQQAENYMKAAVDMPVESDKLKTAITIVFDNANNVQNAIDVCDKYLSKNPSDTQIRKMKASYYMQLKNKEAAVSEYSKIVTISPNDSDSKYYLYKLLSTQGLTEKDLIKKLYKTEKPDYEKAYYEIADMLVKNDDVDGAKPYATLLVNKYPDNANGYILLSEIYKKQGKLKESYEALEKVRDKADSSEAIARYNVMLAKLSDEPLREANSLIANKLYQQALEVLDSSDQENLYVILTQARANYLLERKQNTFELLNKAMSLYPENSDVYCAFGYIYLQEKDIDSARKYVNRSLKINPQNQTALDLQDLVNKAEADKLVNNILSTFEAQNYSETMRLIDEALEINKKDSMLYYYKARTYIAQNNYAASTAALYKSIELDRNNLLAYFYLGTAFDNLSEKENARTYYQKYIDLLPEDDFGESERRDYALARIKKLSAN